MQDAIVFILALVIMLAGLVGVLLPFIPSIPLVWLGVFFYAVSTSFEKVDANFFVVVSVLVLAIFFLDYAISLWKIREFQASPWGVFGAVLGGLVGSLFGVFYAVIGGPIVGAIVVETLRGKDSVFSFATHRYTVVGFVGGTIIKVGVALAIIILFLYQVFGKGI